MADGKKLFVIDNDAGLDDAQAIMMSLTAPDVDVIALTTVTGNASARQVAKNLLRLLRVVGRLDIPIYRGCEKTLMGWVRPPEHNYHGNDGFGDVPEDSPPEESLIKTKHAVQALLDLSIIHRDEITLVALGPLTNLAVAVRMDPDFGKRLKRCYIMGGNYRGEGNVTPEAEFNFYSDPEAAQIVLSDLGCPITLACWELCKDHPFPWDWYDELVCTPSEVGAFVRNIEHNTIQRHYMDASETISEEKSKINFAQIDEPYLLADQYAMAAACNDDVILDSQSAFAVVDTGQSHSRGRLIVDWNEKGSNSNNVRVIKSVDMVEMKLMLTKAFNML